MVYAALALRKAQSANALLDRQLLRITRIRLTKLLRSSAPDTPGVLRSLGCGHRHCIIHLQSLYVLSVAGLRPAAWLGQPLHLRARCGHASAMIVARIELEALYTWRGLLALRLPAFRCSVHWWRDPKNLGRWQSASPRAGSPPQQWLSRCRGRINPVYLAVLPNVHPSAATDPSRLPIKKSVQERAHKLSWTMNMFSLYNIFIHMQFYLFPFNSNPEHDMRQTC